MSPGAHGASAAAQLDPAESKGRESGVRITSECRVLGLGVQGWGFKVGGLGLGV